MNTQGEVTECGLCGDDNLQVILDMGSQPLAERLDSTETYPLVLLRCWNCMLVQLSYIVDQKDLFPPIHPYTTGTNKALVEHFRELAAELSASLSDGDVVVDIAANDGTLLSFYPSRFVRVGVEPTNQAAKLAAKGINSRQQYFTEEVAREILDTYGPAKVITATNVLAHVPDPHDFMEGVEYLLDDDGVFVTENQFLGAITENLRFDYVYHEHLRYYSAESLTRLIGMHGFQVEQIKPIHIHGGSFRTYARKRHVNDLEARALRAASRLHQLLSEVEGPVYGIGATTGATALVHYADIGEYIDAIVEVPNSEKLGHCLPGTSISIVEDSLLLEHQPPYALIFPFHLADRLVGVYRDQGYKGKFIIPLPVARIWSK